MSTFRKSYSERVKLQNLKSKNVFFKSQRYPCEKYSLESQLSFGITYSIMRRVRMLLWKEKVIFSNFEKMILGWKILISISKSKNQNLIFCIKTFFSNYRKKFSIDPKFILKISEEPFCLELLNKAKIMSFERIDQNIFQIFYPPQN